LQYFERAGRFNHAVRLAKEAGMDGELMHMALQAGQDVKLDAARYFEAKGNPERAVQLYHRGGNPGKALELCFAAELFDDLRVIASDLGESTSPETLRRCAEFFQTHAQYDKAVHLLVTAKRYEDALELALAQNVQLTEDMAEKMTPPKDDAETPERKASRAALLTKIARIANRQGNFHLATKKFTQAGDKVSAMEALLKSGDTEKIIFFAEVSRSKEIYVLAANYLQNLQWNSNPALMKSIIKFYTKAKAYEQLSAFYDSCAQFEIDEFRNYEKALGALREAAKFAGKIQSASKERRLNELQHAIEMVETFVEARKKVKTDPEDMVRMCRQLLNRHDLEGSVRVGDVFALLVEFYSGRGEAQNAYDLVQEMQSRRIALEPYLDNTLLRELHEKMGVAMPTTGGGAMQSAYGGTGGGGGDDDGIDEDIDEDIPEDF
jgi:intraflagellar transport protein 140